MAHRTAQPEVNKAPAADDDDDEDDDDDDGEEECQLVSFTNKLPYYSRHICKSSNRSKPTPIPAKNHDPKKSSEVAPIPSSLHRNDTHAKSVAIFSLSSSSSSSSISSLNEATVSSTAMSTRLIPVNYYQEPSESNANANSTDQSSSSRATLKCLNTYREQVPMTYSYSSTPSTSSSSSSSSSSSTSTNPSSKKESFASFKPTANFHPTVDSLTIEQNLFNMVRFDVIKSNFCDYYQLGGFVRSGGFSDIHEGVRLSDNKQVVVKFIPKEKTKNWLMVSQKKYPAEILLHKAVHEIQGVIHVYDYFENAQHWILVMERLHNCQDLFDYLESSDRGRLSEAMAKKLFQQLVQINLAMLRKGVVHRDLKSENILVDLDTESLVLIDFGASAIYKSSTSYYSDFHGTKQYKSPEYIIKKRYNGAAATVWTLGVLLYDMVCGSLPFENEEEITGYKLALKPHLSAELKNLIQRCLSQNPERRPSLELILEHAWLKA